jgi:hypothetical protein
MKRVRNILEKKKARCAVCHGEYQYYPAWPYGDTCCSNCFYADERPQQDYSPHIAKKKEHLPTGASILDIGVHDG